MSQNQPPQQKKEAEEELVPGIDGIINVLNSEYEYEKKSQKKKKMSKEDEEDDSDSSSDSGSDSDTSSSSSDGESSASTESSSDEEDEEDKDKKSKTSEKKKDLNAKKNSNEKKKSNQKKKESSDDSEDFIDYDDIRKVHVIGMENDPDARITSVYSKEHGLLWVIKHILSLAKINGTRLNSTKWKDQNKVKHIRYENRKTNVAPAESVIAILRASKKAHRVKELIETLKHETQQQSHHKNAPEKKTTQSASHQSTPTTMVNGTTKSDKSPLPQQQQNPQSSSAEVGTNAMTALLPSSSKKRKSDENKNEMNPATPNENRKADPENTKPSNTKKQKGSIAIQPERNSVSIMDNRVNFPIESHESDIVSTMFEFSKTLWKTSPPNKRNEVTTYLTNFIVESLKRISQK
jgi:hypothetical protein